MERMLMLSFDTDHFVGVDEVVDVQQIGPPGGATVVLLNTILGPQGAVTPQLDQGYVEHHEQHVRRRQSVGYRKF